MGQQNMYKIGFFNPTNCFKSKPSQTKQNSKKNNSSSSPLSSSYSSFHSRTATVTRKINHFEPCSPKVSCMGSVKREKTSSTSSTSSSSQSSKSTGEHAYVSVRGNNFGGSWKVGDESDLVVKVFLVEELDPPLPVAVKPLGARPVCLWRRRRDDVTLEKILVVKEEFNCVFI
ncbi:hypothetical protein IHE45_06G060800 [Dioscorea alata]|uniref:Uncharacterized protein n=1 Tax=Dioscorea alata TaxID=55571 RepID=A0ACB7VX86_DIOAL|nr:hypothetical protein IHE45_06G060800 [Dioscorea alata]